MIEPTLSGPPAPPQNRWISGYYPAFDGLRAIAILMILTMHYLQIAKPEASELELWTGVDLFFVLSGFLITGILFDTDRTRHYFRHFYIRRALRILPLSYTTFLLIFILTPVLHLHYAPAIWSNPLFVENYFVKAFLLGKSGNPTLVHVPRLPGGFLTFSHLWSLCVEEQFYIVWPVIVWLLPRRKALMNLCAVATACTVALRVYLYLHDPATATHTMYLYYSTFTRCDSLLCGAWIALWLRGSTPSRARLRQISFSLLGGGALTIALLLRHFHADLSNINPVMYTVGYTLVALCASGVLLLSLDSTSLLHRALLHPALKRIGKISYGLYFLHFILIDPFKVCVSALARYHLELLIIPLGFAFSYLLASLSFRFLESPFLKLKNVLAPGHRSNPQPDPLSPTLS